MIVEEISLERFRRFRKAAFTLGEGLNVVRGPNESGKSTLLQAVMAALFWKADSTRREVKDSVTWGDEEGFRIEVRGRAEGKPFHLVKDFHARRSSLTWGDMTTSDPARIDACVRGWLGVGSEAAYRATAGIKQDEVALIAEGKRELSESLQVTVGGSEGGRGALAARDALAQELSALLRGTRGPARNPGPLAQVEEEITSLNLKREELVRAMEGRNEARRRLAEIAREEKAGQERLELLERLVRDTREKMDIEEDIKDFQRRYRLLETAVALLAEDERLAREEEEKFGALRRVREEEGEGLDELQGERERLAKEKRLLAEELDKVASPSYAAWAPWILATGLTLILVGVAGIALTPYLLFFSLGGALLSAYSLARGGYYAFFTGGKRLRELQGRLEGIKRKEARISESMRALIVKAGCSSPESFDELERGYRKLLSRRREIAERLEVILPDMEKSVVEEEARRLAGEVNLRRRRLQELRGRTLDAEGFQGALREVEELRGRLEALREERVRCEVLLSGEEVDEDLAGVEEKLEQLVERRAKLRRKAEALRLAMDWLDRATRQSLTSVASRLGESVGRYLERITGGRYREVTVDEKDLSISVWSPEKGGRTGTESLSRGTVDQLYLAARLSLVDIICGDLRPPLLLDDPFVTFDGERMRRALELLREYARGRQVVIFTCGRAYDAYADRVVELTPA